MAVAATLLAAIPVPGEAQNLEVASVGGHLLVDVLDSANAAAPVPAAAATATPALTTAVLKAYIARRRARKGFDIFGNAPQPPLTNSMVLAYADTHFQNAALAAIDVAASASPLTEAFSFEPTYDSTVRSLTSSITDDALLHYIHHGYVPTIKKVEKANKERRCLSTAIYNEARGESSDGQWAVANVIINRAMNPRFPSTMCGVVYQNADEGRYRCQFTFACDGRAEHVTEPRAWAKAKRIAASAYSEFQHGKRPGVVPRSALYYHTRAVSPGWSSTFREVAEIGAHIFYAPL